MAISVNFVRWKANQTVRLLLLVAICATAGPAFSQFQSSKTLQKAYDYLLNYQLDSCSILLEKIPKNPAASYLKLMSTSIELVIREDEAYYKASKKLESDYISSIESAGFTRAEEGFLKAEVRLQWGLIKLKYGEEFSGFWDIKQAFSLAKSTWEQYPGYLPNYKTLGLLHAMFGLVPEKYTWVLSLFGIQGDLAQGMNELQKVVDYDKDYAIDTRIIMAMIQGYLLGNHEKGSKEMAAVYDAKNRILSNYLYAMLLMKNAQSAMAMEVVRHTPEKARFPFFSYLEGEILLQQGNYPGAVQAYNAFLNTTTGESLLKDATYKTAICYYLLGNSEMSAKFMSKVQQTGVVKNEADNYAQHESNQRSLSFPALYQVRYATDGGYFNEARKIFANIKPAELSLKDQCEYHYRGGRLYHKLNQLEEAMYYYQNTIKIQGSAGWYYAPNAALQLTNIYINEHRFDEARASLKQLDGYKGYPYESSIRQQAKTLRDSLY